MSTKEVTRDHNYSRPLDVHLTCNHPEIKELVEDIFNEYFDPSSSNINIVKKHLKVVLLDLYVAWNIDPMLEIGVHMSPNDYSDGTVFSKGKSRYNQLHIKRTIINVIHTLRDKGLIGFYKGTEANQKVSRIWTSSSLEGYFKKMNVEVFDILQQQQEVIILRDKDKIDIEYEDTNETNEMRQVLRDYNDLLRQTFIDIPILETPIIPNKDIKISIGQHDKFVRRIFNNSSFEEGGRFAGGWWQRINEKQRSRILINDKPTVEIDFKALHPILAYAMKGLDYWSITDKDPYDVTTINIDNAEAGRTLVKLLFLMALNADDEKVAFQAVIGKWDYQLYPYHGLFTHEYLGSLLSKIKEQHEPIADLFCSGAGINLMNIDSQIVEYIIKDFTESRIPLLTIHDSFVVQFDLEDRLYRQMQTAFQWITGNYEIKTKMNNNMTLNKLNQFKTGVDRDHYFSQIKTLQVERCKGYLERFAKHKSFFKSI